jgi:cell division protein ZapE
MALAQAYALHFPDTPLRADVAQEQVWQKLEALAHHLSANPPARGLLQRLFAKPPAKIRGLYIHGDVGRGKTMLMDLFFDEVINWPKRRMHFHAFMQQVHGLRNAIKAHDVIARIADQLAHQAKLWCLDEMQIVDIADAMIVGRLYEALQSRGVILVTTSNLPPERLYHNGLNRGLFLPFIEKLQQTLDVVALDSRQDYRLGRVKAHDTFIHPLGPQATRQFEDLWNGLTDHDAGQPLDLAILGRTLTVPRAAHGCARFTFHQLCVNPLGPADYLALAHNFKTIFISGIPVLKVSQRNEAKRFILMIDNFYDARTRIVATAQTAAEGLAPKSQHGFEFKRTISRLKEMQSASWWGKTLAET